MMTREAYAAKVEVELEANGLQGTRAETFAREACMLMYDNPEIAERVRAIVNEKEAAPAKETASNK